MTRLDPVASRLRSEIRFQNNLVADSDPARFEHSGVHATHRAALVVDSRELAVAEPLGVGGTRKRIKRRFAQNLADTQLHAGADAVPWDPAHRHILPGRPGGNRMPLRRQPVDYCLAPEAQPLPRPTVVETDSLTIAFDA